MYKKVRFRRWCLRFIAALFIFIAVCLLFQRQIVTLSLPTKFLESRSGNRSRQAYILKDEIGITHPKELVAQRAPMLKGISKIQFHVEEEMPVTNKTKEREKERLYYKLGSLKKDHCDFEFLIVNSSICEYQVPFLLILVPSIPDHFYYRQSIRETWGQFARNKSLPGHFHSYVVKLAFILGKWTDNKTKHGLIQEQRQHGDIIVGDFEDSYKNLTRKILFGLKWTSFYCGEVDYVLKIDEDVYPNIPKLVEVLTENHTNSSGGIYGHRYAGGTVRRSGKWAVSNEEFPLTNYPPYMSGTSYVISGPTVSKLLYTSQYVPYLSIEDAFITGVLPRISEIPLFPKKGFTCWMKPALDPCTFFQENNISSNNMNPDLIKKMWLTQENIITACAKITRHKRMTETT